MGTQLPLPQIGGALSPIFAHVYCVKTAGWIKIQLGMEVGLGPDHILLDGDPLPSEKGDTAPQFLAHVCCGQTAGWIKMPLSMEVGLSPAHIVLHGDQLFPQKGHSPQFSAHVYCGQTFAYLGYC